MRFLLPLAALLATSCQSTQSHPIAPPSAEQRAHWEERRLAAAGFDPLEEVVARGLEVQRVDLVFDIICCQPSVQLTRDESGAVLLTLSGYGHHDTVAVEPRIWEELAREVKAGALTPPDPAEARRRDPGRCHSWYDIEAHLDGQSYRLAASHCLGDLQARALSYSEKIAKLALDTVPRCEPWRGQQGLGHAMWECIRTFGPPDPAWNARRLGNN